MASPLNLTLFQAAVRNRYAELCANFDVDNILSSLFSERVISTKQLEHLQQELQNKGRTSQAELFFKYLLDEDPEEKGRIDKFMAVVKQKHPWIHSILEEAMTEICDGKIHDKSK